MNEIPESERMALDFDGWLGSQEPSMKEQITGWIDSVPDGEKQLQKDRLASQFIVAESTQRPIADVVKNWELERNVFAQKRGLAANEGLNGGAWFAGVHDDAKFHEKIKAEAAFRRDERQIVFGPDDAKDAEGFKTSLVGRIQEAAFAGVPYPDALAGWQETATKSPGWREDRTGAHNDVGREVYAKTTATVEKVRPIAEEAFAKMKEYRDGNGTLPLVDSFRELTAEERRATFRLMTSDAQGQPDKARLQAFGEAVGRGFENIVVGSDTAKFRNTLLSTKFEAGQSVSEDSPIREVSMNMQTANAAQLSGPQGGFMGGPSRNWRTLTAEEAAKWNAEIPKLVADVDTAEELRKFSQQVVDPAKGGGWIFQKLVLPAADSLALMSSLAIPGATVAALEMNMRAYQGDEYARLREMGMDANEANNIAAASGAVKSLLDKAGFEFLRGVPAVNQWLKKFAIGGSTAARFAVNAGGTFAAETGIEVMQDHIVPALVQDLYNSNPAFDVKWGEVWHEAWKALPDLALGMVLLSAAGGAHQTLADSRMTRELGNSRAAMTLAGYTDAQMDLIQQQPDNERAALLSQFAPKAAPVGAEREALITRVVEAAKVERETYIEKLKAETGDASDALDYAVRVTRRQGTGWTVTTESGKSLVVDTAEAARRIRQDLGQAASAAEAETLVGLVDGWHGANTEAQRETTFTGETATSDGTSIQYTRGGKITREITDAKTLETLRKEAEIVATQTANEAVNVLVNGSNETFRTKIADAVYQVVQRLEINRSSSAVLTFLHESMESNWRAGMQNGTLTREATQKAVASIAGAFNVNSADAETRAFAERVQRVANGTATDTELRETVSELATADVIGRRKSGGKVEVGSISRAISDAIQRAADESTISGLSKLQGFIRAAKTFFRGVLGTVAAIRKAKQKDGALAADWEAFMHKLTGTSAQTAYDAGRVEDLEKISAERAARQAASEDYIPPTAEEEAAGIAFSVSSNETIPETGKPWSFYHVRNTQKSPKLGARFGQDIEPHGRYMTQSTEASARNLDERFTKGVVTFNAPLVIEFGGGYGDATNWKNVISQRFNGKSGKKLSQAIRDAGYDAIVTVEPSSGPKRPAHTSEIVDLSSFVPAVEGRTFSVSPARDAEYLAAVERGDMATAQRMVDAAARAAGYDSPIVYHGTQAKFNVFDESKIGSANGRSEGSGFYFTTDKDVAEGYQRNGGNVVSAYLKINKALDYNAKPFTALQIRKLLKSVALTEAKDSFEGDWKDGFLANYGDTYSKSIDSIVSEATGYFTNEDSALDQIGGIIGSGVDPATVNEALTTSLGYDAFFSKGFSGEGNRGGDIYVATRSNQVKSADPVTRDEAGNVIPLSQRFNEASNDIRFSISPSAHVELLQRQVDAQLKRDPDRRRKLAKLADDKLQALAFAWTTDRVNARGVKTRALVEQRSERSLNKEQAFREAARREELEDEVYGRNADVFGNSEMAQLWTAGPVMEYLSNPTDKLHGRLMSKSSAVKSGKLGKKNGDYDGIDGIPRVVFGGSLMPDQVAQELYESGLLKDAYADTLWDAIKKEVASAARFKKFLADAKDDLKQAKKQAREEAAEWRREQDEMQAEDWNPKERLLRDMRALDAVLSVLPPELRAKVGGFIKLAELTTDKARMKEIERRMKKMGGLVEDYLQKENIEALDRLIEKATPATGAGEKPKGKIGVEGHRVFKAVEAVRGMTTEQVDAERARLATAIEDRITKGGEIIDLLEQEQILEMFGAFDEKTAAEMDRAVTWLDEVYRTGRNGWRMAEEMRLAEVAQLKADTIAAVGEASKSGTQEQKKNATKLKNFAESVSLNLLSFTQVLESVVGEGHPLVARWSKAARDATNQRTDSILAANARFEASARAAFGGVSKLEMSRRLWEMANNQRISLPVVEGGMSSSMSAPIEKIRQFEDGTVNPVDLGFTDEEAKDLIDQLNGLPEGSRKKKLSVERVTPGTAKAANYTEAQAMALTMLGMQQQYAANLAKHGYTAEVMEAAEASLSDAAKMIRSHLLKEYKDGYAPLAKVFREMFGIDLPSVANYSPAAFLHAGETRDVDPFGGMVAEGGFRAGFLKSRKEHLAAPRPENAFQTYQGHVAQMEHWRAFAPLVRELRGVFGSVEVKDSILSNRGAGLESAAQGWVTALEQNGLQQRAFASGFNPIFRYITGKQATLTLAWKAGTLMKQGLAAIASATRLPSGVWLRGVSRVMSGKIDVSSIRNSPMIQRRINSGFSPEVRAAMVSLFNGKPSVWSQFALGGMEKIAEVDAFFASIGTAIAYDYHYNEGLKSGMSEEAAREMALVEAEDNLGRTAQPTELMDRSLYELGMSPAERVGFMFASNQRKDTALMISAFAQWKKGNITGKQFGQTLAVAWLAAGFFNAIIGAAWRDANDDDDDEWLEWEHWSPVDISRHALLGPLGGIPLANMAYNSLLGYGPNDPFKPIKQAQSAVAKIDDGDKTEPIEKTVRRAVDIANGAAIFIPKMEGIAIGANVLEQAFNIADNFVSDTEGEAGKKEKAKVAKEKKAAKE